MEKKLTVSESAKLLGVSKEAIYNRIRRGSLKSVVENGVKYVILTQEVKKSKKTPARIDNSYDAYIELLKEEIKELKERNRELEKQKERLIKEKEALLIESRERVESIYKERDYQLKTLLSLATKPILEYKKDNAYDEVYIDEEAIEVDIEQERQKTKEIVNSYENWQDLRDYLKQKGYSKKEKKMIKEELSKKLGEDDDLLDKNGKIFIKKGKSLKKILKKKKKK